MFLNFHQNNKNIQNEITMQRFIAWKSVICNLMLLKIDERAKFMRFWWFRGKKSWDKWLIKSGRGIFEFKVICKNNIPYFRVRFLCRSSWKHTPFEICRLKIVSNQFSFSKCSYVQEYFLLSKFLSYNAKILTWLYV